MSPIILSILFILSGFFMKYSDDLFDENNNLLFASIFGMICGLVSAIAAVNDTRAAYICISILISNVLALKVDGIHHIVTLGLFVIICIIWGIPELSLVILLVCILAALSDEVGHELISNVTDNVFLNLFFEYRFVMKLVIFLLAIFSVFDILVFIYFMLFEISYVIAGIIFEKLN